MTLPDFEYDQTINVPLAAVDAEMAVYHQIMRDSGLMVSRVENIPNRLVVYVVTKFSLGQEYGDCGRLFIQFLDEKKTRLSFDVAAPDKFGAARFAVEGTLRLLGGLNPEKLKPDEFARGFSVLRNLRFQFLHEICDSILARLMVSEETSPALPLPEKASPIFGGGRPGLPDDEKLRRLALLMLEQRLKQKDPGLTRGEFVFSVQQKLKIPLEMHTLKNATQLRARAQKNAEQAILLRAENMAAEWQKQFE